MKNKMEESHYPVLKITINYRNQYDIGEWRDTGQWARKGCSKIYPNKYQFSRSVVSESLQLHELQHARLSLSITNPRSLPKLLSVVSVMPSNHLILYRPLLLPSIFPRIRVFSNESALHIRWPKYWSFSFNISPCNEHSGLISFRMDWLDLLAVQGTVKSLLHYHTSKA